MRAGGQVPFSSIVRAKHGVGLDFHEGVLEIDVFDESGEETRLRVRVGSLDPLCHGLISALNIYGTGNKIICDEVMPNEETDHMIATR